MRITYIACNIIIRIVTSEQSKYNIFYVVYSVQTYYWPSAFQRCAYRDIDLSPPARPLAYDHVQIGAGGSIRVLCQQRAYNGFTIQIHELGIGNWG